VLNVAKLNLLIRRLFADALGTIQATPRVAAMGAHFRLVLGLMGVLLAVVWSTEPACEVWGRSKAVREHRVLVLVDSKLMEVFFNWLVYYARTCPNSMQNLLVVCMDARSRDTLESRSDSIVGCSTEYSFELGAADKSKSRNVNKSRKESSIWKKRIEIVSRLLAQGVDVVLSDVDALWLDGPAIMQELSRHSSDNWLVASRAWWPWEQFHQWGATACMGFAYIKSCPFSLSFFGRLSEMTILDDQIAVNVMLARLNVTWARTRMDVGSNSAVDRGVIAVRDENRQQVLHQGVVLLAHDRFLRQCHSNNKSISIANVVKEAKAHVTLALDRAWLAHCRVPKGEAHSKKQRLKVYKLWRLCNSWRSRAKRGLVGGGAKRLVELLEDSKKT